VPRNTHLAESASTNFLAQHQILEAFLVAGVLVKGGLLGPRQPLLIGQAVLLQRRPL
jgi:hypothetical protein